MKAVIEEEIYLRKVRLGPMQISYTGDTLPPDLKVHDLRYQNKSVDAWLLQRAAVIATTQPEPSKPITLKFDLTTVTEFEIKNRRVNLSSLSITFHPRTQWLAQTVQLDARNGIYDYLRGRIRWGEGTNSYTIKGVNFDAATPLLTPPPPNALGVGVGPGLLPGEADIALTLFEDLGFPKGMEIPKLKDIIRPEDLEVPWRPIGASATLSGAPRNTEQSP